MAINYLLSPLTQSKQRRSGSVTAELKRSADVKNQSIVNMSQSLITISVCSNLSSHCCFNDSHFLHCTYFTSSFKSHTFCLLLCSFEASLLWAADGVWNHQIFRNDAAPPWLPKKDLANVGPPIAIALFPREFTHVLLKLWNPKSHFLLPIQGPWL